MADKKANLIIALQDKASAGLRALKAQADGFKKSFADFKFAAAGVVAGLAAIGAAAWSAIKSYAEQEAAVNKLNQAMVNQGIYTRQASKDLLTFASSLQQTTTFSDDAVIGVMSLLTSFGLTGAQAKQATKAVLDLSAGLGIDLNSAAMLVGKAFQGQTESLGRYGIKIDQAIPAGQKFAAVLEAINNRAGGQAEAALNTTVGRLDNFKNRVGELNEAVGKMLIPVLSFFIDKLLTLLRASEDVINSTAGWKRFAATVGGIFVEIGRMVWDTVTLPLQGIAKLFDKLGIDVSYIFRSVDASFNGMIAKMDQWASSAERKADRVVQATANEEKMERESLLRRGQLYQQEMDRRRQLETEENNKKIAAQVQKEFDDQARYAAEKAAWDAQLVGISQSNSTHEDKMAKLNKVSAEGRIQAATSMFNTIATLSTSKNKQLAAVGKAGAIATAMINTYQGISEAWKLGPILGPILAPFVAAAGFANVAKIQSVQMAEGGVVMPRSGGTLATIGEAGKAEAVIPLDDERSREAMGGLGGPTISINAGVIVADPLSVKEFALKIDEELFRLRRNRLSVS